MAIDDSQVSLRALEWAAKNLLRKGDEVHLLHVLPSAVPPPAGMAARGSLLYSALPDPQMARAAEDSAEAFIASDFLPTLERHAGAGVTPTVELLRPATYETLAEVLVRRSQELGGRVLVVGAHRKGLVGEVLEGSTAKSIASVAEIPLVVIH